MFRKALLLLMTLVMAVTMTACNPKDVLYLVMNDVPKEEVTITKDNIDEYIGFVAMEIPEAMKNPESQDRNYMVCLKNLKYDEGLLYLESERVEVPFTLEWSDGLNSASLEFDSFSLDYFDCQILSFPTMEEAEKFAASKPSEIYPMDGVSCKYTLVSKDAIGLTVDYNEEKLIRKIHYGGTTMESPYVPGFEY